MYPMAMSAAAESAKILLTLYEQRREPVMREARDFVRLFEPQSMEEFTAVLMGPHSGHLRMVMGYWDMAASFVVNAAIDAKMFDDANSEHWGVFAKVEPFLPGFRKMLNNPRFLKHLEEVCLTAPEGRARIDATRERSRNLAAMRAAAQAKA